MKYILHAELTEQQYGQLLDAFRCYSEVLDREARSGLLGIDLVGQIKQAWSDLMKLWGILEHNLTEQEDECISI